MSHHVIFPLGLVLLFSASGCRSPYYADRGAAAGGLGGAAIGSAIGHHNGNTAAGALIGAAAGALTGAAVGDAIDQDVAASQAAIQQSLGRQLTGAATSQDVVAMTQAGLSDQVIVTHIQANGVAQTPTVQELIGLRQQGVSDTVIQALQTARTPSVTPPAPAVIVHERYGPPVYWREPCFGPPYARRHPAHRHAHFGFSIRR